MRKSPQNLDEMPLQYLWDEVSAEGDTLNLRASHVLKYDGGYIVVAPMQNSCCNFTVTDYFTDSRKENSSGAMRIAQFMPDVRCAKLAAESYLEARRRELAQPKSTYDGHEVDIERDIMLDDTKYGRRYKIQTASNRKGLCVSFISLRPTLDGSAIREFGPTGHIWNKEGYHKLWMSEDDAMKAIDKHFKSHKLNRDRYL